MTQYNSLDVKLSNSQLNKLKLAIKNPADVVLRLSSNMIGNSMELHSHDDTNFLINYFYLLGKLQIFVKLLLNTYQLILNCQKLNYLRWYNLVVSLVDF